jgi:hypothetical protein
MRKGKRLKKRLKYNNFINVLLPCRFGSPVFLIDNPKPIHLTGIEETKESGRDRKNKDINQFYIILKSTIKLHDALEQIWLYMDYHK